jgi:hypothetical protein
MNLPASSSGSKLSDESSHQPPGSSRAFEVSASEAKQERSAGKPSKKDQDLPLKLRVASAVAASGYYTRINVALSATSARGLADVTDVDVFGTRYDVTFSPTTIAVSCKSGESRGLSPAREIFYLRGVLDYVRAGNGVVAFPRKPVPPHLHDLGRRLDILVLSGSEVEAWCNALVNGVSNPGYFQESAYNEYLNMWARTDTGGLARYLRTDYWFHFDFRNLQNVVGHLKKAAPRLAGKEPWHNLVVLDTAAHLCLTLFDLCRQIRFMGLSEISETTAAYLFGGAPSFKARRDLYGRVHQLLSSTGVTSPGGPTLPPLEPSYTAALAELAVHFIDRPHAAVLVPQIVQDLLWRALGATGAPPRDDTNFLAAEKLTQDLLDFLKVAAGAASVPKVWR